MACKKYRTGGGGPKILCKDCLRQKLHKTIGAPFQYYGKTQFGFFWFHKSKKLYFPSFLRFVIVNNINP